MRTEESVGRWRAVLGAAAAVNLIVGVALSFRGGRDGDLFQVARWAGEWVHGLDPYALADAGVDYPPWALVLLSPLAWVPNGVLTAVWVAANLGLVAWMVTRLSRWADEPHARQTLLAALLLCAASLRTLNQFSVLSFALAIARRGQPVARDRRHADWSVILQAADRRGAGACGSGCAASADECSRASRSCSR